MVKNLSDEQLMINVKAGDLDALSPLFEKYHVKLFNFFLRMIRNRDISQDLTQEVFRRILKYRETYDEKWMFRSWMYQIARNVQMQQYSQEKIRFSDYHEAEEIKEEQLSAIEEMEQESRNKALYEAMALLSEEQREIIELARFQGLKYQEISKITGNSVPAIKVKVHRAIKKLRELYFETV